MPSGFLGGAGIGPQAIGRSGAPPDPVPVAGAELLTNGGFDSDTAWTKTPAVWSISDGVASAAGGDSGTIIQPSGITQTWMLVAWTLARTTGNFRAYIISEAIAGVIRSASGTYTEVTRSGNDLRIGFYATSAASVGSIDNCSYKALSLSSLLSTRTYSSADCDLSAAITRTAGTQAGLVARLDSSTSPANFIIAYLDGASNVKVDKCVGGTYTNIISGAVTYGATKRLRLVCSGTSVSAYYDGTQVGSTVTVSDAGIVSNVRHGKFSTYASNAFAGYVAA